MTTRAIPKDLPGLMKLGAEALAGVQLRGVTLGVAQNTAPRVAADHYDLFGEPGENPTNRGKQAALNAKRDVVSAARAARNEAQTSGRAFCAKAVDVLKAYLGRSWNSAWAAAGFSRPTIAVSTADVAMVLLETRNYLRQNPGLEVEVLGVTAAAADAKLTAVDAANTALNTAIANRDTAAEQRDAAVRQLRARLSGLREELQRLMPNADHRWYEFGFSRPVDRKMPSPVTGVELTPGLPGQVLARHAASARAIDYRVSWAPENGSGEATVVGLFADLAVLLSDLPGGVPIVVSVTARNEAGETPPTSVKIIVPMNPALTGSEAVPLAESHSQSLPGEVIQSLNGTLA